MEIKFTFWLSLLPVGIFLMVFSCAKPPDYPIEPVINYLSTTKDTLKRGDINTDSSFVTIAFTDGDGDIGHMEELHLYLEDSRNNDTVPPDLRKIPIVLEAGASNGIKGEITFKVFSSCCFFPSEFYDRCNDVFPPMPYDSIIYTVYMQDRAGHLSNKIQIPPIYIRCF
jgi:hypothetical protein